MENSAWCHRREESRVRVLSQMDGATDLMKPSRAQHHRMAEPMDIVQPLRVLLVDASVLVRYGVKTFFSKRRTIMVVGAVSTEEEALIAIPKCQPDVVVSEIRIGRTSGIDMCRSIHESYPTIRVLFFTDDDDIRLLLSSTLAGARGYLLKTASSEELAKSIAIVSAGHAVLDKHLIPKIIARVRNEGTAVPHATEYRCSTDELRLLSLLASGKTNKEIACELNEPNNQIKARLRKIYRRLSISRRSEAARYYAQLEKDA